MVVLIAEPDEAEARRMLEGLTSEGFLCEWARTGPEALARASACEALVAEIALPGVSGMDLVGRLRDSGITTPLIFVTALCTPEHRVRGLEAGADDYLCKPFTLPELAARLRALIRRSRMPSRVRRVGVADLVWEPDLRRVHRGEQRLDLTPKEYTLLALLLERPGQVVSRRRWPWPSGAAKSIDRTCAAPMPWMRRSGGSGQRWTTPSTVPFCTPSGDAAW